MICHDSVWQDLFQPLLTLDIYSFIKNNEEGKNSSKKQLDQMLLTGLSNKYVKIWKRESIDSNYRHFFEESCYKEKQEKWVSSWKGWGIQRGFSTVFNFNKKHIYIASIAQTCD